MINPDRILEYINKKKHVSTKQLCDEFDISESTARRVTLKLADQGLITRFHGGASALTKPEIQSSVMARFQNNSDTKTRIAKKACEIIHDGATVILMGGSTICEMCQFLKDKHITVITNSMLVLNELQYYPNIRLIVLGGLFNLQECEVGGLLANMGLKMIRADFLFMGTYGFDEYYGFITANPSIELYWTCLECSKIACVLADSSKYMSIGGSVTARTDQIHYLFSDSGLAPDACERIRQTGINVVLCDEN